MGLEKEITIDSIDQIGEAVTWLSDWIDNNIKSQNKPNTKFDSIVNVVAFYGEMGSGKTTLISNLCRQLGVIQTPSSPTFALVNGYTTEGGEEIFHFDFYRIKKLEEVYDLGYDEYVYSGNLCLMEWPELVESLLPQDTLRIKIDVIDESKRKFSIME